MVQMFHYKRQFDASHTICEQPGNECNLGTPQAPYNMILYTDQILVPSSVSISTESTKLYQSDVKSGNRCDYSSRA
jgi:hypothetical protein